MSQLSEKVIVFSVIVSLLDWVITYLLSKICVPVILFPSESLPLYILEEKLMLPLAKSNTISLDQLAYKVISPS